MLNISWIYNEVAHDSCWMDFPNGTTYNVVCIDNIWIPHQQALELDEGVHILHISCFDAVGNSAPEVTHNFTIGKYIYFVLKTTSFSY